MLYTISYDIIYYFKMEEHINEELRKHGVLTRSQKRELIDEIRTTFNKTVSDEQIDNLSALFLETSIGDDSCILKDYKDAVKELQLPNKKRTISESEPDTENIDSLLAYFKKIEIEDPNKRQRTRGGGNLSEATPYLYILLGLAIKDFQKMTQERVEMIVVPILNASKKVLEALSNKDNCVENLVISIIDKRLISFFKYVVIGSLARDLASVDPTKTIKFLLKILVNLLPFAQKGVGVAIVSTIGYFVYHYVHYYSERISEDIKDKMTKLKGLLDTLEQTSSENLVNNTNTTITTTIEKIKKLLETKELAEDGELMRVIADNIANEDERLKEHIGEYDDTMTMEELKKKIKEKADAAEGQTPGGAKKRRATKKKKARKTKTRKTRKSRKTRKNKK